MSTFIGIGNSGSNLDLGSVLYVATTGDDTDTTRAGHIGNPGKPFLTLEAARDAAVSGDLIYVFPGTYTVTTTDADGLAKTGVNYYFEPNTYINKATAGPMFKNTASSLGTSVLGYGIFTGSGSCTFIYQFYSSTELINFNAKSVSHSTYSIFRMEAAAWVHFNVDYCTATGGSCMQMNQNTSGATIVIDAIHWKSTASNVIYRQNWWYYTTLTVRATIFESTVAYTIDGYTISNTINLNISYILGITYSISTASPYGNTEFNITCNYMTGMYSGNNVNFSGVCGTLTTTGDGRIRFVGGTVNYLTASAGYVECSLGSYAGASGAINNPFITINSGVVKVKSIIAGYQFGFTANGGALYLDDANQIGIPRTGQAGIMRTVNGGSVYVNDFYGSLAVIDGNYWTGIHLVSGKLYLRGKLNMSTSRPNPSIAQADAVTNLLRSNAVVWAGGDLILDGCTILTSNADDFPIVCRGSVRYPIITAKGISTNRTEYGGLLQAKKMKLEMSSYLVYDPAGFTLTCDGVSSYFETTTVGKTLADLATEFIGLINLAAVPVTATVHANPDYWYVEADTAGKAITWDIYNTPYTGKRGLGTVNLIRDNSFAMIPVGSGLICENTNII